LVAQTRER